VARADCVADLSATVTSTWDEAKRLRLVESDTVTELVAVTMFDGAVVAVTALGETVATRWAPMPRLAAGQFLLTLLVVAGLVACAVALWRRGRPSWLAPAVGTAVAGAVVGAVVGLLATIGTSGQVAAGWTVPILGLALLAGLPVALLSARERKAVREPASV
jgi:hypothetical protein